MTKLQALGDESFSISSFETKLHTQATNVSRYVFGLSNIYDETFWEIVNV